MNLCWVKWSVGTFCSRYADVLVCLSCLMNVSVACWTQGSLVPSGHECMLGQMTISASVCRLRRFSTRATFVCFVEEESRIVDSAVVGRDNKGLSYVALGLRA